MSDPRLIPRTKTIKTDSDFTAVVTTSVNWNSSNNWNDTWEWSGDALILNKNKPRFN